MCKASPLKLSFCIHHYATQRQPALWPEGHPHVPQKGFLPGQPLRQELSQAFNFTWTRPREILLSSVCPPRLEALRVLSIAVPQQLAANSSYITSKGEKGQPRGGRTHVYFFP